MFPATKEYYTFNGWYDAATSGTLADPITTGTTGNLNLYAYWTPINYTIEYELDGGTNNGLNPTIFNADDSLPIILEDPTKEGYNFIGWFDAAVDGNEITEIASSDLGTNLTLYARWTIIT